MSTKRRVLRVQTTDDLSESEVQSLVDDVADLVSQDDIFGRFIGCGSNVFIEWEGDADLVDSRIEDVLADDRVSEHTEDREELQDKQIDSMDFEYWYGHADPSDARETFS